MNSCRGLRRARSDETDAPILHDNAPGYDGAPADIMARPAQCVEQTDLRQGRYRKRFAEADLVLEHTFRMPIHHQGYLEPQSFLSRSTMTQGQCLASTKGPFARAAIRQGGRHSASQIRLQASTSRRLRRQKRRGRVTDLLFSRQAGEAAREDCFNPY